MFIAKLDGLIDTESAPCCCYDDGVSDKLQHSVLKTPMYVNDFHSCDGESLFKNDIETHGKVCIDGTGKVHVYSFGMDYESVRIPLITSVFYNEPYTIVKWSDNTITKAAATKSEPFNKEIGLSIAISKKVFESYGYVYPRAALKSTARNAQDQTEKTRKRKEYKARHKKNK